MKDCFKKRMFDRELLGCLALQIEGFERELREMKQHAHNIHALQVYREVLGE